MKIKTVDFLDFSQVFPIQDTATQRDKILDYYAIQPASATLSNLFSVTEDRSMGTATDFILMDRASLVIVGDKTLYEWIQEEYCRQKQNQKETPEFKEWYAANRNTLSGQIVAAGLMAGKHVEAWVPEPNGRLPDEPIRLQKAGYTPDGLSPEIKRAWEQYFRKFGFESEMFNDDSVKDECTRHETIYISPEDIKPQEQRDIEEKRALDDARQRLRAYHYVAYICNKEVMSPSTKAILFRSYMQEHNLANWDALVGSFEAVDGASFQLSRSEPVSACICLLAGIICPKPDIRSILNPVLLTEEKDVAAHRYFDHLKNSNMNDHDMWLGFVFFHGQRVLLNHLDSLMENVNLKNPQERAEIMPFLQCINSVLHDANQALNRPDVKKGYLLAAKNMTPTAATDRDAAAQKRFNEVSTQANNVVGFLNALYKGDVARIALASPIPDKAGTTISMHIANLAAEQWALNHQAAMAKEGLLFQHTIPSFQVMESLSTLAVGALTLKFASSHIKTELKGWKLHANSFTNRDLDDAFFLYKTKEGTVDMWFSEKFQDTWHLSVKKPDKILVPVTEQTVLRILFPPEQPVRSAKNLSSSMK